MLCSPLLFHQTLAGDVCCGVREGGGKSVVICLPLLHFTRGRGRCMTHCRSHGCFFVLPESRIILRDLASQRREGMERGVCLTGGSDVDLHHRRPDKPMFPS